LTPLSLCTGFIFPFRIKWTTLTTLTGQSVNPEEVSA
jgi:hypothetical protein